MNFTVDKESYWLLWQNINNDENFKIDLAKSVIVFWVKILLVMAININIRALAIIGYMSQISKPLRSCECCTKFADILILN